VPGESLAQVGQRLVSTSRSPSCRRGATVRMRRMSPCRDTEVEVQPGVQQSRCERPGSARPSLVGDHRRSRKSKREKKSRRCCIRARGSNQPTRAATPEINRRGRQLRSFGVERALLIRHSYQGKPQSYVWIKPQSERPSLLDESIGRYFGIRGSRWARSSPTHTLESIRWSNRLGSALLP
jgi:hypothetical protein